MIRRSVAAALAALTLIVVLFAAYVRAVRSEMDDASGYLLTLMELRRSALEDYLETIRSEVVLWSRRETLHRAIVELEQGWDRLPGDRTETLQRLYSDENPFPDGERQRLQTAGDGSLYSRVHEQVQPRALRFLEHHGYHDVYLFDPEGDLIYTAYKERDFATNLDSGPWRETGLGRAFRAARDAESEDYVVFTDFESYEPGDGGPTGFAASPVHDEDGSLAGVLAFQVPVNRINEIMHFTGGMGETGETYIVGEDLLMGSDSRFADTSTILGTAVDTETVRRALAGESGVDIATDYRGAPVVSAFGGLQFEGLRWAVIAEIDEREVKHRARQPRRLLATAFFGLAAISAVAALMLTYLVGRAEKPESWRRER